MSNIELVLDNIVQIIKTEEKILFSRLDPRYAYSQIPLDVETRS